jgi:hypothetical protein
LLSRSTRGVVSAEDFDDAFDVASQVGAAAATCGEQQVGVRTQLRESKPEEIAVYI